MMRFIWKIVHVYSKIQFDCNKKQPISLEKGKYFVNILSLFLLCVAPYFQKFVCYELIRLSSFCVELISTKLCSLMTTFLAKNVCS